MVFVCNHAKKSYNTNNFTHQYYFVLNSDVCCMKFVQMPTYPTNL